MSGLIRDTKEPLALKEGIKEIINNHLQTDITPKTTRKIGKTVCVIEFRNEEE